MVMNILKIKLPLPNISFDRVVSSFDTCIVRILQGLENIDLKQLAQETEGFSGSDLHELCRKAMIYRVRDYLRSKQQNQQSTSSK